MTREMVHPFLLDRLVDALMTLRLLKGTVSRAKLGQGRPAVPVPAVPLLSTRRPNHNLRNLFQELCPVLLGI